MIEKWDGCTGCGACAAACPRSAITMQEDAEGFRYPAVSKEKCVSCGGCLRVCPVKQEQSGSVPRSCYAVSAKQKSVVTASTSGGLFSLLAQQVLSQGGYVCGAALTDPRHGLAEHIIIQDAQGLALLRGSKYVQSKAWEAYPEVEKLLKGGSQVLFSGTPCQVAALQSYLRKPYASLLTAEVICHGVPSGKMLGDYLSGLEERQREALTGFSFRDKKYGWGYTAKAEFASGKQIYLHRKESSYFDNYIRGYISRKSCYACPFAREQRCADITMGDFWDVFQNHGRELLREPTKWSNGITACMVNTDLGNAAFEAIRDQANVMPVSFEEVSAKNYRLVHGDCVPAQREKVFEAYISSGYAAVERLFQSTKEKSGLTKLKLLTPGSVKFVLKCLKK